MKTETAAECLENQSYENKEFMAWFDKNNDELLRDYNGCPGGWTAQKFSFRVWAMKQWVLKNRSEMIDCRHCYTEFQPEDMVGELCQSCHEIEVLTDGAEDGLNFLGGE